MTVKQTLAGIIAVLDNEDVREVAKVREADNKSALYWTVNIMKEVAKDMGCHFSERSGVLYVYTGTHWQSVEQEEVKRFLSDVSVVLGRRVENARNYRFMEDLLRQFRSSMDYVFPERTPGKVLVNLRNGTYEIYGGRHCLRNAAPEDFLTYRLEFDYDPDAEAPLFRKFLDRVLPDRGCQNVLAEYMGYVFAKRMRLEKMLILYGSGANGKSVFFDIVRAVLGESNVSEYTLQELTKESGYSRAELQDVLLNYSSEINGRMDTSIFKMLSSGEPVSARRIYGRPFIMCDYARLAFNCNELPSDIEYTDAFFRRFIIIPFNETIPVEERDPDLSRKITGSELSGVFNWILGGLDRLMRQGRFSDSELVKEQEERFRMDCDSVYSFIKFKQYVPSESKQELLKSLHNEYSDYCRDALGCTPVIDRNLAKRLRSMGFKMGTRASSGTVIMIEKRTSDGDTKAAEAKSS